MPLDTVSARIITAIKEKQPINFHLLTDYQKQKLNDILEASDVTFEHFCDNSVLEDKQIGKILFSLIAGGVEPASLFHHLSWRNFEILINLIFDTLGFNVFNNFRFKDDITRYEIDVLAFKYPYLYLIDCKFHKNPTANLRRAAEKQKIRTDALWQSFPVIHDQLIRILSLPKQKEILLLPLIISWRSFTVNIHQKVPIVPYSHLSGFVDEVPTYRDRFYLLSVKILD